MSSREKVRRQKVDWARACTNDKVRRDRHESVDLSRQRLEDSATRILCGVKKQKLPKKMKPKRKLKKVVDLNRVAARASVAEAASFAPAFTLIKREAAAAGGPPMWSDRNFTEGKAQK